MSGPAPARAASGRWLVYIGQMPGDGTGSPVIVLRHLRRLGAAGWRITVIGEAGQDASACVAAGWEVGSLPLRRSWWPPFREGSPALRALRTHLLAGECRRLFRGRRPDALLGYLAAHADFFPEIAARLARRIQRPLTLLVHDDAAGFARAPAERARLRARHSWIIAQSWRCWFVSPELAQAYAIPAALRRVLLPLPEGWRPPQLPRWRAAPRRVFYAGALWPEQLPLLGRLAAVLEKNGARLAILSRSSAPLEEFLRHHPADWQAPFAANRDALAFLAREAAGLLVSYADTVEAMPWIATSFPSKWVEYAHLGLPCAVVAPRESAVGRFAADRHFPDFFTPDHSEAVAAWARDLGEEEAWLRHAAAAQRLADGEFSPETIQGEFVRNLTEEHG